MLRVLKQKIKFSIMVCMLLSPNLQSAESENRGEILMGAQQSPVAKEYNILFLGNSHTRNHNVPEMVKVMMLAAEPNAVVDYRIAPGIKFLDERLRDSRTLKLLDKNDLSHVVLQAQKYSQSRRKYYSTKEAEKLVAMAHKKSAKAVMFPEWGQRGRKWEAQYVHDIYEGIAKRSNACIAPVGLAWDHALSQKPLKMHAADGNHANHTGAFLSALVLFETITGNPASALPNLSTFDVPFDTQALLRNVASQVQQDFEQCV